MRTLLASGLSAIVLWQSGCVSFEPDYQVEAVVFDPGAVGTWKQVSPPLEEENRDEVVRIDRRDVRVSQGRLQGRPVASAGTRAAESSTDAYTVTLKDGEDSIELLGYLVRAGEETFAGVQISKGLALEAQNSTQLVSVPMHVLMRYERTGDTLILRTPKQPIVWAPVLFPLDGAEATGKLPILKSPEKPGVLFTPSIDRLVEAYAWYGSDQGFWREPTVYRRVQD